MTLHTSVLNCRVGTGWAAGRAGHATSAERRDLARRDRTACAWLLRARYRSARSGHDLSPTWPTTSHGHALRRATWASTSRLISSIALGSPWLSSGSTTTPCGPTSPVLSARVPCVAGAGWSRAQRHCVPGHRFGPAHGRVDIDPQRGAELKADSIPPSAGTTRASWRMPRGARTGPRFECRRAPTLSENHGHKVHGQVQESRLPRCELGQHTAGD